MLPLTTKISKLVETSIHKALEACKGYEQSSQHQVLRADLTLT